MRDYVPIFPQARLDRATCLARIGIAVTSCDVTPSHQTLADASLRLVGQRPEQGRAQSLKPQTCNQPRTGKKQSVPPALTVGVRIVRPTGRWIQQRNAGSIYLAALTLCRIAPQAPVGSGSIHCVVRPGKLDALGERSTRTQCLRRCNFLPSERPRLLARQVVLELERRVVPNRQ